MQSESLQVLGKVSRNPAGGPQSLGVEASSEQDPSERLKAGLSSVNNLELSALKQTSGQVTGGNAVTISMFVACSNQNSLE